MSSPTLIGFLIRDTHAESFDELLGIEPGLSVLYGLNGAGKSRTLEDIRRFWAGIKCQSLAVVQLPRWSPEHIDWHRETERGDWFPDWARRAGMAVGDEDGILKAWLHMCLEADEVSYPGVAARGDADERRRQLVEEWLGQRVILVASDGTQEQRRWVSAPAFLTDAEVPATNAEVELYDVIAAVDGWSDHASEPFLEPVGITAEGRTISCACLFGIPVLERFQRLVTAGQHHRLLDLTPLLHDRATNIDEHTQAHLRDHRRQAVTGTADGPRPSPELVARVRELEERANTHYSGVLQDAPTLRLHVDPIGFGQQVEWFVADDARSFVTQDEDDPTAVSVDASDRERRVAELSSAQRRWARWSIEMAVHEVEQTNGPSPRLILIDEPEAALHRSAEARMADYLSNLATDGATQLLLATHSPELLDLDRATVHEVKRRGGQRRLTRLSSVARENMDALGLLPSDLLRRQRGFILVEGLHDQLVLEGLFGTELPRLRVEILPIRGTSELSPAKIAFLLEYTPAHVFILLDNVITSELSEVWGRALDFVTAGRLEDAQIELSAANCLKTDEGTKLRKLLTEVLLNGHAARLTPFGLSQADVIEYLPAAMLVPGAAQWPALRDQHRGERQTNKGVPKDFKAWLTRDRGADFSPEPVRRAVQSLDTIPQDLLRLLKTVEAHVQRA